MITLKLFDAITGKYLTEIAGESVNPGKGDDNTVVSVPFYKCDKYNQIINYRVVVASEPNNYRQILFVSDKNVTPKYEANLSYFDKSLNTLLSKLDDIKKDINSLPIDARENLIKLYPSVDKAKESFDALWKQVSFPNANIVNIKSGDIICLETITNNNTEKNVFVCLVEDFNPISKNINTAISVVLMYRNELIDPDNADGSLSYGVSFYLNEDTVVRKPTSDEIKSFFEIFKRY